MKKKGGSKSSLINGKIIFEQLIEEFEWKRLRQSHTFSGYGEADAIYDNYGEEIKKL